MKFNGPKYLVRVRREKYDGDWTWRLALSRWLPDRASPGFGCVSIKDLRICPCSVGYCDAVFYLVKALMYSVVAVRCEI